MLQLGERTSPSILEAMLRNAVIGPFDDNARPPEWLLPFQVDAMRRVCASIEIFRGALLADAVGLGKTYVALAVAARFRNTVVAVPAALVSQWKRVGSRLGVAITTITHEALSRGASLPKTDLIIIDEAHRFRNPNTRRYEHLCRGLARSRLLLLTATPVVNRASDLAHLLRLFVSDNSFSLFGMASIDDALSNRDYKRFARAASAAVVARSAKSIESLTDALPHVRDGAVIRASSIDRSALNTLLALVDSLQFPNSVASHDYALLRLHLLHRLASSTAAFRDTVRRHLTYVERALSALERGETLSRSTARRIFSTEDELLFALGDLFEAASERTIHPAALRSEQGRLVQLLSVLAKTNGSSPKSEALAQILKNRNGRKTIVFTTAVATALDLARGLGWKEIAVVGAGVSWIASGQISVDETLSLFAPKARDRTEPHRAMRVSTLIATDLASEGLNLQDADAVVHYDLPWTPLKLEQRVGRIARLGSAFRFSDVHWFAPPQALDQRLRLQARIAAKVNDQIGLNVVATSKVGRSRIVNEMLDRRERIGRCLRSGNRRGPCFTVVRGPSSAIVAVRWVSPNSQAPELITLSGSPPQEIFDIATVDGTLTDLLTAPESQADPPGTLIDQLLLALRERLATADRGANDQQSRRLARRVLRKAYEAGRRRDSKMLAALDAVLSRLRFGLSVGGERTLADVLNGNGSQRELSAWLDEQPEVGSAYPAFEIVAALFGDGTTTTATEEISRQSLIPYSPVTASSS
jgi:superfamily II DNA or RNA helicase